MFNCTTNACVLASNLMGEDIIPNQDELLTTRIVLLEIGNVCS